MPVKELTYILYVNDGHSSTMNSRKGNVQKSLNNYIESYVFLIAFGETGGYYTILFFLNKKAQILFGMARYPDKSWQFYLTCSLM